jgi:hypothetical protein
VLLIVIVENVIIENVIVENVIVENVIVESVVDNGEVLRELFVMGELLSDFGRIKCCICYCMYILAINSCTCECCVIIRLAFCMLYLF